MIANINNIPIQDAARAIENSINTALEETEKSLNVQKGLYDKALVALRSKGAQGDKSENAEYAQAKEAHDNAVEAIIYLQKRQEALMNFKNSSEFSRSSNDNVQTIGLRTTVRLELLEINNKPDFQSIFTDNTFTLMLVPHDMGDFFNHMLAIDSAVGHELDGLLYTKGTTKSIVISSYKGEIKYRIKEIY